VGCWLPRRQRETSPGRATMWPPGGPSGWGVRSPPVWGELAGAPHAQPAGAPAAPRAGRRRAARALQKNIRPLLRQVATAFPPPAWNCGAWEPPMRIALASSRCSAASGHRGGSGPGPQGPRAPGPVCGTASPGAPWSGVSIPPPASGRTVFHLATSVSIPLFAVELAAFARQVGAGPDKQIVLVLDRAGWKPTSVRLRVPEHVPLLFLPPYSPELQPTAHLLGSAAAHQHGPAQPPVRHDRRPGGRPVCSLPGLAAAPRPDPLDHPLSRVASADPQTTRTQAEIVSEIEDTPFGTSYTVEGAMATPDGRAVQVRVVWFIDSGEALPRLVTAYPLKGAVR